MEPVVVWQGRFGDPVPLFGPLPAIRDGHAIAYEYALPQSFEPRPGRNRLQRTFLLTDVGVALAQPCWRRATTDAGDIVPGVDPDQDEPAWYVDLMHVTDRGDEIIARDLYIDVMVPADGRHQRLLDLDEFADAIEYGTLRTDAAIDGLRRWQRFLDTYVHRDRDPRGAWSDFPPRAIARLAALPSPLGPVVTWAG
jgi:Protein of unknown function (DUF402)